MLIFVFNYLNTAKYTFLFIFLWNSNEFTDQTNICITYLICSHRAHAQCMLALHVHMCVSVYILSAFVCVQLCFSTHTNTADVVVAVDVGAQPVYFAF